MINKNSLISYASNFSSFLIDSKIGDAINRIILFGSVARGDFGKESDVDIFIDTDKDIEKEVYRVMSLFKDSRIFEAWKLKGIENEISVKIGKLKNWSLRREVISSGIVLYGKYKEMPEKTEYYMLIKMDMKNIKTAKQMSIWRKLYGYRQRIGEKTYTGKGLVENLGGKKLGKSIVIVPMRNRGKLLAFLNEKKVRHTVYELWSDNL